MELDNKVFTQEVLENIKLVGKPISFSLPKLYLTPFGELLVADMPQEIVSRVYEYMFGFKGDKHWSGTRWTVFSDFMMLCSRECRKKKIKFKPERLVQLTRLIDIDFFTLFYNLVQSLPRYKYAHRLPENLQKSEYRVYLKSSNFIKLADIISHWAKQQRD